MQRIPLSLCLIMFMLATACTAARQDAATNEVPTTPDAKEMTVGTIGAIEMIGIQEAKLILPARIDTGATTTSVNAQDIKTFERDGKKWVRFVVPNGTDKAAITLEKPVKRVVSIKRHGHEAQKRQVVELTLILGKTSLKREVSLTDRSHFEFPILIGRNVLEGKAVVDVAQSKVLETELPQ